ncbi:MAG: acyl carrier protein [Chloroflexota bacterium]
MNNQNQLANEQIAIRLKQYITNEFLYDREGFVLTNDFQLIEQSIVDSMGIFRLITFMEEAFGITVDPGDVLLSNFESVETIADLVNQKVTA